MKKLIQLLPLFILITTYAQDKAVPFFKNGEAQVVELFKDESKWIRHDLWVETSFDSDGDGKKEILMSFQSVPDSLAHKTVSWNADSAAYITTTNKVVNPKNWEFVLLENGSEILSTDDQITFISPDEYRLEQNYPNPFNPITTIQYTLPINRKVSIKIYNVNGQLVNTLVNNKLVSAGTHKVMWNGKNTNGLQVSTGMYFYSLEWAGMKKVKSMTLLK